MSGFRSNGCGGGRRPGRYEGKDSWSKHRNFWPRPEASRRDESVVRPVNARLLALAKTPEFAGFTTWLDLFPSFVDAQGRQDPRLFVDGLHPSEAGYRVWRDRLVPALAAARASAR